MQTNLTAPSRGVSADPIKKSTRSFQCREALWEQFEQMADELECSIDYLVNEAMKRFVRERSRRTPMPGAFAEGPRGSISPSTFPPPPPPPWAPAAAARPAFPAPPVPPPPPRAPDAGAPPLPSIGPPATWRMGPQAAPPIPAPHAAAWPAPTMSPPFVPTTTRIAGRLTVIYAGRPFVVDKDRFVIGRGRSMSDLTIKDPNVSRQHALVELVGGQYFVVDMGSMNGVEHRGTKLTRKPIEDGDVIHLCGHDLVFRYG